MPEETAALTLVLTTLENDEQAAALALQLVDERLIACGNVVAGLSSIYRWQGRVERAGEVLLIMKTRPALVARLFERVAELHPYDLPELVALPAEQVTEAYARWVLHETTEVIG